MAAAAKPAKPAYELSGWERFKKDVVRDKWLYLLILPGMLFMLIFRYIPIFGNVIAFMDFNPYNMWNSTWVGFDQFIKLFNKPAFMQTFYNTLYISILKMVCGFPIPIILALMMNEMRNMQFKKVAQTLLYLPHFISWVVMAGLIMNFLDPSTGLVTALLKSITGKDLQVLTDKALFVPMLIITDIYKTMGWGTIIYDQTHYSRFCVDDNGVVTYGPANEGTKNWVSDVADLYAKGYITPNITQDTDRDEQMANGGFGVTYSWCAWNNPDSAPMMSFYASNPDAKWVPIDMVKGSNGNPQEDPATSAAWAYFAITNTASDPERLYATWDDMCDSDNYIARRFGIEGTDYKYDENGQYVAIVGPDSEENTSKNIGLKLFDNLMNRKDECNISNTPETTALFKKSGENSRYAAAHLVEWKDPASFESWTECSADIEAEKDQYLWGVIAGQESIDDWDNYVATLNSLGLEDVLAEANEDYATLSAQMEEYLAAHGEA